MEGVFERDYLIETKIGKSKRVEPTKVLFPLVDFIDHYKLEKITYFHFLRYKRIKLLVGLLNHIDVRRAFVCVYVFRQHIYILLIYVFFIPFSLIKYNIIRILK